MNVGGTAISDPALVSEEFNRFFVGIGKQLTRGIPHEEMDQSIETNTCYSCFFKPTTPEEVLKLIKEKESNKATGNEPKNIQE